jgi:MFS family permease
MASGTELKERIEWRALAPSFLLVFNSFVWYILSYLVFISILEGLHLSGMVKLVFYVFYYVAAGVSAVLGPMLFARSRASFLKVWLLVGACATLFLFLLSTDNIVGDAFAAAFLGASVSLGLPSCLSYFADSTSTENRGRSSGIVWSAVGFTVLIFLFLINYIGLWESIPILAAWRLFGVASFLAMNKEKQCLPRLKSPSYLELIRKREVLLYLFPWIMFSIINFAEWPILEKVFGTEFFNFVQLVEFAFIGVFAIVGGFVADIAGRKRVVIAGFMMLGIEYATMSVFSISSVTWYLFLCLDGVTWGLFASIFWTALWGDLGENYQKEKYYALGGLPYLLAGFLPTVLKPYVGIVGTVTSFSLASFFLFLAVLPLMYAPETLPEKSTRRRELKIYIEKAKQTVEKYA